MVFHRYRAHRLGMITNPYRLIYDIVKNTPVFLVMRGSRLIYESENLVDAERVAAELEKAIQ